GVTNSVTLKATVKNAGGQVVGGAPVAFSIDDATGGGEYVSPVVVYTDSAGTAQSTFSSGSLSTDSNGVKVSATVVGTAIKDSVNIVIGGTAGSVTVGRGTVVQSEYNNTVYELPMSVLVADANGNPVSGAVVTLSTWPSSYRTGGWYDSDPDPKAYRFVPYISGSYDNEDVNRNLILDAGEDVNVDGDLTPPNSAAGDLPETVTTDANGVANFNLVYLKANAIWIVDRISASTLVFGTETTSSISLTLPAERTEAEDGLLSDASWPAWVADVPGAVIAYAMPWFTGWGFDYFTAVYGTFTIIGPGYTDSTYDYTINTLATSGTIITDVVSITDGLGRGIVVPFRVVVK
ncbi:MAG: Ig-like domain-containing protein, partial [Deltaproteobacteria bacterium]|nr:Ig-like domain-containing protein [Deltaproteobacteria bacterium]